jgi:hypothetical protein
MHHLSHQLVTPPRLAAEGSGFAFVSQFRVTMRLDPDSDWTFFEYRQYIKGNSTLTHGHFSSSPHSRANWVADGTPAPGNSFFRIPGGLTENYREDGIVENGITSRFGYRSNAAVNAFGIEDRYLPSQRNGRNYHSLDTCGMRGTGREAGVRITYNLFYEGRIIDTRLSAARQTVLRRQWVIRADDIM